MLDPNKTYDILFTNSNGDKQLSDVILLFTAVSSHGAATSGIRKLAQRYLMRLFSRSGTVPGEPHEGTNLLPNLNSGRVRTSVDLQREFADAQLRIVAAFSREQQRRSMPLDEQYREAKLIGASVRDDVAILSISLISQAGETLQFTAPIAIEHDNNS